MLLFLSLVLLLLCISIQLANLSESVHICVAQCLTVTCRTCNPEVTQGRRFDSAPGHCQVTTLGELFTHMCLCHQAV